MNTNHLAQANIAFLEQGAALVGSLDDELYRRTRPPVFASSIGSHFRHALDHVALFLADWERGQVDYDARDRGTLVETDRQAAMDEMHRLVPLLEKVADRHMIKALRVKMDCGGIPDSEVNWAESSVMRELQFLVSHTIHHYAIIAMILQVEGQVPPEGFGYSPSTLKYLQQAR